MAEVIDLQAPEQFDEVIADPERAAIVDFWADWCGPCKMMAPVLKRLAREYDGRLTFAKLNVDEFPEISRRYAVTSIPTLIVFRQGKPANRIGGFKPEAALRPHLDRYALPVAAAADGPGPAPAGGGVFGRLRRLIGG